MMYDINFRRFTEGLLPQALRGSIRKLVGVMANAIRAVSFRFRTFSDKTEEELRYDSRVFSMEAMLNARFRDVLDVLASGERILIEDGDAVDGIMLYPELEHEPVMVGMHILYPSDQYGAVPFVVKIPAALQGNQDIYDQADILVRTYKLAGTKYKIEYYE